MKNIFLPLVLCVMSLTANAQNADQELREPRPVQFTYKTYITCQQAKGYGKNKSRYEAGLVETSNSTSDFNLVVVKHEEDGRINLVSDSPVLQIDEPRKQTIFKSKDASLAVADQIIEQTAVLSMGSASKLKNIKNMKCYRNNDITYDLSSVLE